MVVQRKGLGNSSTPLPLRFVHSFGHRPVFIIGDLEDGVQKDGVQLVRRNRPTLSPYSGGSFGEERGLKERDQSTVLRKLRGRELYPRLARFHGKEKSGYQTFGGIGNRLDVLALRER